MTTMPKPVSAFETRSAKDADPTTASLVADIGLARETDYFLMADQLTDREKEIFAKVRVVGEAEILPMVNEYWERGEFPFDLIPKLAALNVVGDHNLGDHGCTSMSAVAAGLVTYELSRIDGSIATFFAVHVGLAMQSLNILGSEEQRRHLCDMEALVTYEGTAEIQSLIVGRHVTGQSAFVYFTEDSSVELE